MRIDNFFIKVFYKQNSDNLSDLHFARYSFKETRKIEKKNNVNRTFDCVCN